MEHLAISDTMQEVAERLKTAQNIIIVSHEKPDGDALGSSVAIATAAISQGKKASILLYVPLSTRLERLVKLPCPVVHSEDFSKAAEDADLIVMVDTCSFSQINGIADEILKLKAKTVVIDHHSTADTVGSIQWSDPSAAATGLMTFELIEYLGWDVTSEIAEALIIAILTDTGWLHFSNTDGRCLRATSRLVDIGVPLADLYKKINQNDRLEKLRLLSRVLAGMQMDYDGKIASMTITSEDFILSGAKRDDTENIINEALRIGSVEAVALFIESDDIIRASLRSRKIVDVSRIASSFGGGGHARASGFRHQGTIEEARALTVDAITKELANQGV